MPIASIPQVRSIPIVLDFPPDNYSTSSAPVFVWQTTAADFETDMPSHFQIVIASDSAFTTIVRDKISFLHSGFEYEASAGVWVALPSTGLAVADFGKRVRYNPAALVSGSYYWRVRPLQQV